MFAACRLVSVSFNRRTPMAIENSQKPPLWLGIETLLRCGPRLLLLLVGGAVVAAVLYWQVFETRFYRAAIPAQIGLTFGFATTGSNVSLWGAAFAFDRKACGGAIFDLSNTTVATIRERGLDFFQGCPSRTRIHGKDRPQLSLLFLPTVADDTFGARMDCKRNVVGSELHIPKK